MQSPEIEQTIADIRSAIVCEKAAAMTANNHFAEYEQADKERLEAAKQVRELTTHLQEQLGRGEVPEFTHALRLGGEDTGTPVEREA